MSDSDDILECTAESENLNQCYRSNFELLIAINKDGSAAYFVVVDVSEKDSERIEISQQTYRDLVLLQQIGELRGLRNIIAESIHSEFDDNLLGVMKRISGQ